MEGVDADGSGLIESGPSNVQRAYIGIGQDVAAQSRRYHHLATSVLGEGCFTAFHGGC